MACSNRIYPSFLVRARLSRFWIQPLCQVYLGLKAYVYQFTSINTIVEPLALNPRWMLATLLFMEVKNRIEVSNHYLRALDLPTKFL